MQRSPSEVIELRRGEFDDWLTSEPAPLSDRARAIRRLEADYAR